MMDWAASFSILTRPGVMTYILTGVLFTVVIAAAAVFLLARKFLPKPRKRL